jgi:DNA-binding NarL/FixJ family response regulator
MDRPLIVLEGPEGIAARDLGRLRAAGYELLSGFRPARRASDRTVCHGVIESDDQAASALLAALAGHGLLVEVRTRSQTVDRLVDDLSRLGPVDHRLVEMAPAASISPEARAVLALLAEGLTLGEAAADLGLSRRTADRRLAEARRALGTERTTEAVARARRLGWFREPPTDSRSGR